MDYNVVGMWRRIGGEHVPDFERIVVLDMTDASDGNGLGVGIADFTTRRLYDKLDLPKMYLNGLTSQAIEAIKIPIVLESDRQALQVGVEVVTQSHFHAERGVGLSPAAVEVEQRLHQTEGQRERAQLPQPGGVAVGHRAVDHVLHDQRDGDGDTGGE